MNFELVEIVTKDKLVHQGIVHVPDKHGKTAMIWIHGLTGKFYGDPKLINMLAEFCDTQGIGFASFNTRGHDIIAGLNTVDTNEPSGFGHRIIGAGYEIFKECVFDIDAAIEFFVDKGFSHVILAGHSTGANKACYYAAIQDDKRIAGIVLAGPISDRLSSHNDRNAYKKNITMLRNFLDKGKGNALLTKANWFPATADRVWSLIAPNTLEDVFNYGDEKNVLSMVGKIVCPLLVVFSGNDEYADRPIGDIQKVFDAYQKSNNYTSIIIPDTTHGYEGKEKEFVAIVVDWVASLT